MALITLLMMAFISPLALAGPMLCSAVHGSQLPYEMTSQQIAHVKPLDISRFNNEKAAYLLLNDLPRSGSHLGVGGDINYTIMGRAHANRAVIYDMDPSVLMFHHLIRLAFVKAQTPDQFIRFFETLESSPNSSEIRNLKESLKNSQLIENVISLIRGSHLSEYFHELQKDVDDQGRTYTFLGDLDSFDHVRRMSLENRIAVGLTNQFEPGGFASLIRRSGMGAGSPIKTIYLSNTLEYRWMDSNSSKPVLSTEEIMASFKKGKFKLWDQIRHLAFTFRAHKELRAQFGNVGVEEIFIMMDNIQKRTEELAEALRARGLSSQEKLELEEKFLALFAVGRSIQQMNRSMDPWLQFWRNLNSWKLDSSAIILQTSRETQLFGNLNSLSSFQKSTRDAPQFDWNYAQIPVKDLGVSVATSMANNAHTLQVKSWLLRIKILLLMVKNKVKAKDV